ATGFALLNLLLVLGLLPETHPPEARRALPRKRDLNPLSALQRVFTNPQVRRLCAAFFLFFLSFNGFTAVLVYEASRNGSSGKTMLSPSRSFSRVTKAQRGVEGRERRTAHSPVIASRSHGGWPGWGPLPCDRHGSGHPSAVPPQRPR
ncbi:MAG: hypothetical protein ACKOGI_06720, partial [Vulcanococcus sp.]